MDLVRVLGAIPGPIIFGALLDKTCILWSSRYSNVMSHSVSSIAGQVFIVLLRTRDLGPRLRVTAVKSYSSDAIQK